MAGALAVTLASAILAAALLAKDFRLAYVAQYCSRSLAWHYALSAFWVGQAGSLLLWAWLVGILAMVYRFWPEKMGTGTSRRAGFMGFSRSGSEPVPIFSPSGLRSPAFAILMAYQCFLVAMMIFATTRCSPASRSPLMALG